ncbi:MAG: SCP2 sterol-binding domain-containing protein [Pseudomonadota bacterium]
MSEILDAAVAALTEKLGGADIGGVVKFAIDGAGAVLIDGEGARVSDDPADVTLVADADTFQGIMSGDVNPTSAFMTGKLKVDGDMGLAMKLASMMG